MKPPAFWHNLPTAPGGAARLLSPFSALYAAATARRIAKATAPHRAGIPVICVGNLNAGGTGKTPTVIAIIQHLAASGFTATVVTRGYGGSLTGPVRVEPKHHSAGDVGDEPILLSAFAPVWVARDRAQGVVAAEADGAQIILLDDGFQNPHVSKDLSIVVVDAARGFGNGRVLPAGPLREPVAVGLARADLVLSIGNDAEQNLFQTMWGSMIACPQVSARLTPLQTGMDWDKLRVLAFAGIGTPEKFFQTLRDLGAEVVRAVPLSDHQSLPIALLHRMEAEAKAVGLQLVTTEKDAVRLPDAYRQRVLTVPVRLTLPDWSKVDAALQPILSRV
ncbi:tetraacyldisaccharide 4'-kinase [Pseudoruegeria sp. SK021]|uniref:tetraacyldisaccharide 4'-kinase n=1 Tax=Pseudoruegeria sp. SK021 TaxID=1933035 RepID=UPI000A23A2BC|nr:tetraacyldisaccharide 4'-kinase [Pseudoruegeria sp. SK021]OSP55096.1 tetraacyldisaccharide 4'-kinase [Pseudoruegeria sp. SK021]